MLTQNQLKEVLHYEPETGIFTSKINRGSHIHIGSILGYPHSGGYLTLMINYKKYFLHRLAWLYMTGKWPKITVDHINTIRNDNRWINLREATSSSNSWNARVSKRNKWNPKGVSWCERDKSWRAYIRINEKRIALGTFKTKEEAHAAYCRAALEYHGEFANFG